MIDSILIGMTGLDSFSEGLKVISNNAANLNTPGFKGSTVQFGDLFYSDDGAADGQSGQTGHGVTTFGTTLDFAQGTLQSDSNPLDLGIQGDGLFVLKDSAGAVHYTRAGQFEFNDDGVLVDKTNQQQVVGTQGTFSLDGHRSDAAKATTTVVFHGNVSDSDAGDGSGPAPVTVSGVTVLDGSGKSHSLTLVLTADKVVPGQWNLVLSDGTTQVGTGTLQFVGGQIDASSAKVTMNYAASTSETLPLTLDFSSDVTSFAGGSSSTLAAASNDGLAGGSLTGTSFDATGAIVYAYSNGQTVTGDRLQLARFQSTDALKADGSNEYDAASPGLVQLGTAGDNGFGSVQGSVVELSNVDLSQEFSDLVIVQRGYQASSQVVTTADQMLQELFSMTGSR